MEGNILATSYQFVPFTQINKLRMDGSNSLQFEGKKSCPKYMPFGIINNHSLDIGNQQERLKNGMHISIDHEPDQGTHLNKKIDCKFGHDSHQNSKGNESPEYTYY